MSRFYVEEKLLEYREREFAKLARLEIELARAGLAAPRPRVTVLADKIGRQLVRWGTRLQEWARARAEETTRLAGAEE